MSGPVVRFAPSPTGFLHIGNARTALLNWLFARSAGGRFILRVEDTDQARSEPRYERDMVECLSWLGLDWDEGPVRQSERLELYHKALDELSRQGLVYPCFCTEEELAAARKTALARHETPGYDGRCARLGQAEQARLIKQGRPHALRFRSWGLKAGFTDLLHGEIRFEAGRINDFVVMRASGMPAYNLAVAVDDALMGVTHVIRGEDHISNTPRQLLILEALGHAPPAYAHHGLLLGPDRLKLSKRHGHTAVRDFRAQGVLPGALANYLAFLGGGNKETEEVRELAGISRDFDLAQAGSSSAVFDQTKLMWFNTAHLRRQPAGRLARMAEERFVAAGLGALSPAQKEALLEALKPNLGALSDLEQLLPMFAPGPVRLDPEARAALEDGQAREVVAAFAGALGKAETLDEQAYRQAVKEVSQATGAKGRRLYMPLRAALTGLAHGPRLEEIIPLLGRETILARLAGWHD